jgi:antitoxin ParD1/3/4
MTINLTPEQIAWLQQRVADGSFASLDEAAQFFMGDAIAHAEEIDLDDLEWAKPLVDEAEKEIAEGKTIPAETVFAELRRRRTERRDK